jgi:N-acetylglucosamine-6-sulfatase
MARPWGVFILVMARLLAPSRAAAEPRQPNIVVVMTDDQRRDLVSHMPQTLDLVATHGTTFTNAIVSHSQCAPSRTTAITGRYAHNTGVASNFTPADSYDRIDFARALPVALQRAGYHTAHVGKYVNFYGASDPTEIPLGYDDWFGLLKWKLYDYDANDNGVVRTYGTAPEDYQTDVIASRAAAAIRTAAASRRPFVIWVAPVAPHDEGPFGSLPPRAAPRHVGAFAAEPLPMPPSFNEADVSDKPTHIRRTALFDDGAIAGITTRYRAQLASLLAVDDLVAQVVAALEETGTLSNTIVVFTSDNGFLLGEHRLQGKLPHYQPSTGVPLLVRGPGVPIGVTQDALVSNVDLAATIADLTGAKPDDPIDGRSFRSLLERPDRRPGNAVLLEGWPIPDDPAGRMWEEGIVTARYRYTEQANGERELYDLRADPDELDSRHDDPAYTPVQVALARLRLEMRRCVGPACRPIVRLRLRTAEHDGILRVGVRGLDRRYVRMVTFETDAGSVTLEGPRFRTTFRGVAAKDVHAAVELWDGRVVTLGCRSASCAD